MFLTIVFGGMLTVLATFILNEWVFFGFAAFNSGTVRSLTVNVRLE